MMKLEGRVDSVYRSENGVEKYPQQFIEVDLEGILGDSHAGFSRSAGGRKSERRYPRGTKIRNYRQWSAVSIEELAIIAENMGIPSIDPGWIGANVALRGVPEFTQLPKGSTFAFPEKAVLLVEEANLPCTAPGDVIGSKYSGRNFRPNLFPKAAMGRRGLVGVVERPGIIRIDDVVIVEVYEPKIYSLPPLTH
ncbi:MAG: MOSC domain-containing protein [Patescibacteria group bacterium]|nr:MOSC domain-containing protein [Patescibacteria group bacterium]